MSREDLVVGSQQERRATGSLQGQQVAHIGMHKYLRNARSLSFARPDREGVRETDFPVIPEDFFLAVLEQICDTLHSVRRRNEGVRTEAKFAGEIASGRPEGKYARAGQEVVEGLLLDRIDTEAARAAGAEQLDPAALCPSHEAQPTLTVAQLAGPGTHVALHPPIVQRVPIPRIDDRGVCRSRH